MTIQIIDNIGDAYDLWYGELIDSNFDWEFNSNSTPEVCQDILILHARAKRFYDSTIEHDRKEVVWLTDLISNDINVLINKAKEGCFLEGWANAVTNFIIYITKHNVDSSIKEHMVSDFLSELDDAELLQIVFNEQGVKCERLDEQIIECKGVFYKNIDLFVAASSAAQVMYDSTRDDINSELKSTMLKYNAILGECENVL